MADLYIEPSEVTEVLGAPSRRPDEPVVQQFISEAQSRVEGALGPLPTEPRNEEIAGIIRDIAVARCIFLMNAGQNNEVPRQATSLRDDAMARLRDLDARILKAGGVGEVDDTAFSNPATYTLWELEDFMLVEVPRGDRDSDPRF